MSGAESERIRPEERELAEAAEGAVRKMKAEYRALTPDALDGECWAEVERLEEALNRWRGETG